MVKLTVRGAGRRRQRERKRRVRRGVPNVQKLSAERGLVVSRRAFQLYRERYQRET